MINEQLQLNILPQTVEKRDVPACHMIFEKVRVTAVVKHGDKHRVYFDNAMGDNFWVFDTDIDTRSTLTPTIGSTGDLVISLQTALDRGVHPSFELTE